MTLKHALQSIISGDEPVRFGTTIQAASSYLRGKKKAVQQAKKAEFNKKQEAEALKTFISETNLWFNKINLDGYVGEGAEQRVYEYSDSKYILKLNDSIFYNYWEDYFHSLLLHNYFFPHLAYELLGFYEEKETLYAVVKQIYVKATEQTNLEHVNEFLLSNGFKHKKNNDYFHPDLGIILEDLHDENVLSNNGVLHFIDTVFYLTEEFYKKE
jgi:Serine/Threonine/Tyrosine Kinase found in polyvalent proteins